MHHLGDRVPQRRIRCLVGTLLSHYSRFRVIVQHPELPQKNPTLGSVATLQNVLFMTTHHT
jgi:hypothetical protein